MVDGLILAAGRGSRLGGITDSIPKCLSSLCGKTLLDWQLSALSTANVRQVTVVAGYRADALNGDFSKIVNPRWDEGNMVRTLMCAQHILEKCTHVISYSDIAYHHSSVTALLDVDEDIVITYDRRWFELWSLRFDNPLDDAETFCSVDGKLASIGDKTDDLSCIQGQYMGLIKVTPAGWKKIFRYLNVLSDAEINKLDMTSLLQKLLHAGEDIATVAVDGSWVEVDLPSDIHLYEEKCFDVDENNIRWLHDWRC
jgi:choline kinase